MEVEETDIPDILILKPGRFHDQRGFFSETYNKNALAGIGITTEFVQDNHSLSEQQGTIRGLHFQSPPYAQDKLVYVIRGAILDVAVDIRHGSPTFGRHVAATISATAGNQIFMPAGFAHGFCTLEPKTEVFYKVSSFYSPAHDLGLRWNDPELGIDWPVATNTAILSDKDRNWPLFSELPEVFRHESSTH
jgi:dTDP-4-dehydrorhamnose 3,5-epimerase